MTYEEAKEFSIYQEPSFLKRAKKIGNKQSYVCPCCKNGSGKNGTGITLMPDSSDHPNYHCFVCDFTGDVFDLAKEYFGCTSVKEVFETVYDYFGLEVDGNPARGQIREAVVKAKENHKKEVKEEVYVQVDYTEYLQTSARYLDPTYLMNRGISEKTQRHYMIGTDRRWLNPILVERYKKEGKSLRLLYPSPRCIIPTSKYSYLARDTRENLTENQENYAKQKVGKTVMYNEKFASRSSVIFVTEGEIDAISFYEASNGRIEATGLGSVSNWSKFVARCSIGGPFYGKPVVLALDNDEVGMKTSAKIKAELEKKDIPVVSMIYNEKDPNAALVKNRYAFSRAIQDAINKVKELQLEKEAASLVTIVDELER